MHYRFYIINHVGKMASFFPKKNHFYGTVMTLSFRTDYDRSGQTVQTQTRLLLEKQSDQGLHCLLFDLHHYNKDPFKVGLFV